MDWTRAEMDKVRQEIDQKARNDQAFRALCLQDAHQAVKQVSGKDIPQGFTIRFVENDGAHLTHVLPDYLPSSGSELSEAELEQVSAAGSKNNCPQCGSSNSKNKGVYIECQDCGYTVSAYGM